LSAHFTLLARRAADIPGSGLSRVGRDVVAQAFVFFVVAAGPEAAVEDADESVAGLAKRGVVAVFSSAHRLVVGAGARRPAECAECPLVHGIGEPVVAGVSGSTVFSVPEARVMGDVPA
jgi:hypothetical protein